MNIIIELKYNLFYIEYFLGVILLYILFTYILVINNIFNILIHKVVNDCLSLGFILIILLIINESLFFILDLNISNFIGLNKIIVFDYLSIIFKFIIACLSFIFFSIISTILKDYKLTAFELLLLLLFNLLGLLFLCSSSNLILIFLSLELVSFSSYFLISFKKAYYYSIECSIKYLIISTISGFLFLTGSLLIYYYLGSISIQDITLLIINIEYLLLNPKILLIKELLIQIENFSYYLKFISFKDLFLEYLLINRNFVTNSKLIIELGILLLVLSIIIKLSMSPFHLWSLEIYEKLISIITFFFIILSKFSYFIILYRFCHLLLNKPNFILNSVILLISLLSIIIGSCSNLIQKRMKTLIIYSSISHLGYLVLTFMIGSAFSMEVFYFYLLNYILSNIIIWFLILSLIKQRNNYINKLAKNITDFIVLNKTNKIAALSLLIILFSIGGLPPFVGFFNKLGIFLVLISEHLLTMVFLIGLSSLISIFYYIRLIKILYFENITVGKLYKPLISFNCFLLCLFSFMLFFWFINPKLLYLIIHNIILNT